MRQPHTSIPIALAAGLAGGMMFLAWLWPALAHTSHGRMKYPAVCCNGDDEHGDCQEIPSKTVKPVKGGWQVTLVPGDHWMVTKPHSFFVSNARAKESTDGAYHVCLYPNEDNVQCFFAPPMAF